VGQLRVMGQRGDTKIIWDADNEDEVANAQRTFDDLVGGKKFRAYSVVAGGGKGTRVTEFDADAERLVIVPPMAGG
jgi:hypothetical protein